VFTEVSEYVSRSAARGAMAALPHGQSFLFQFNHGTAAARPASVYRCIAHEGCDKHMRIVERRSERLPFALQESGEHAGVPTGAARQGIAGALKREVDSLLLGGAGPMKCRRLLSENYISDPETLALIPSSQQLKNRKAYLKRTLAGAFSVNYIQNCCDAAYVTMLIDVNSVGGWEITCPADLMEWAHGKMCSSRARYFNNAQYDPATDAAAFAALPDREKHELLVLDVFEHDVVGDDGSAGHCFGLIMSSRALLRNIVRCHASQHRDGLLGATDGTYRLHFGTMRGGFVDVEVANIRCHSNGKVVGRSWTLVRTVHVTPTTDTRKRSSLGPICLLGPSTKSRTSASSRWSSVFREISSALTWYWHSEALTTPRLLPMRFERFGRRSTSSTVGPTSREKRANALAPSSTRRSCCRTSATYTRAAASSNSRRTLRALEPSGSIKVPATSQHG